MSDLKHIFFRGVEVARSADSSGLRTTTRAPLPLSRARSSPVPTPELAPGLDSVDPMLGYVLSQAGLNPALYRTGALQRRLPSCLRVLHAPSSRDALRLLQRQPELLPKVLDTLLIGVSEFFRDQHVFDALEHSVLPQLLTTRPRLRVLSAGCANGQELYSVAILLDELGTLQNSELLGIDCRPDAIAAARAAVYHPHELEPISPARLTRYFHVLQQRAVLVPKLVRHVKWKLASLHSFTEPGWDLILFRNVAIYMTPAEAEAMHERWVGKLTPGGVLMTGKAERPQPSLGLHRVAPCLYRMSAPNGQ